MPSKTVKKPKTEVIDSTAKAKEVLASVTSWAYANNSYITSSNWDVRIVFCEYVPSGQTEPRAALIFSHQQAKALAETLTRQIAIVEQTFGPIAYSPDDRVKPN